MKIILVGGDDTIANITNKTNVSLYGCSMTDTMGVTVDNNTVRVEFPDDKAVTFANMATDSVKINGTTYVVANGGLEVPS